MKIIFNFVNGVLVSAVLLWSAALILYIFTNIDLLSFQRREDIKRIGRSRKDIVSPVDTIMKAKNAGNMLTDTSQCHHLTFHPVH